MNEESFSQRFARNVLKSPQSATLITVLLAASGFFSWLAAVVVCLVSLTHGVRKSLPILLSSLLPLLALGAYNSDLMFAITTWSISFALPWLLSVVLYRYAQWQMVMTVAVGLGVAGLLMLAIFVPHYTDLIVEGLKHAYQTLNKAGAVHMPKAEVFTQLKHVAGFLPGVIVMVNMLQALVKLMLARGLQASVENPGGLKKELLALKGQITFSVLFLGCLILALFGQKLAAQLAMVLLLPAILSGLSVLHWFANKKELNLTLWSVPAYIMIFLLIPYSLLGLMVISVADIFFDFRKQPEPTA